MASTRRFGVLLPVALLAIQGKADDPTWGCGLLGHLPGITQDGQTDPETQKLIEALKVSSSVNKVTYWNWNLAPQTTEVGEEHLSEDFIFMPSQWGAGVVNPDWVRQAGAANFLDSNGKVCPATMGTVFMGSNEPDIQGSCMGTMFGKCTKPCSDLAVAQGDCPVAYLTNPPAGAPREPNKDQECNCWQFSHATGVGYWPLQGCSKQQPLISLWDDPACVDVVMQNWNKTAQIAVSQGYKYLTTPMVAVDISYAEKFIAKACTECQDASCGCPVYIVFHFYAYDCQPQSTNGYAIFQERLDAVAAVMEKYPFVKGAIINEVGMLNCQSSADDPICVPNSGKYPASKNPERTCPSNPELPHGLPTFMEKLFEIMRAAKTKDGRRVVKQFSWFNQDQDGGTYNLKLFHDDGKINALGQAYMRECSKWGQEIRAEAAERLSRIVI